MLRSVARKVLWVGRTASTVFGLALVLALLFGAATAALGATGGNFVLGGANTAGAVSKLTANIANPALQLVNTSTGSGATALNLQVAGGKPPMRVNSSARVANLNADRIDGKDSSAFAPSNPEGWHEVGAPGEPGFAVLPDGSGGPDLVLWTNYGDGHNTAGFYKDPGGVVHLKGLVKWATSSAVASAGCDTVAVFTLPAGYRPAATEVHPSLMNDAPTRIDVLADGRVAICNSRTTAAGDWFSLDGISFRAAN